MVVGLSHAVIQGRCARNEKVKQSPELQGLLNFFLSTMPLDYCVAQSLARA